MPRRSSSGRSKRPGLGREEQIQIRCALAEAWLLQDDIRQATEALGRPPEAREGLDPARLSDLWRMHGRLASARGEPSRGIALSHEGPAGGRACARLPRHRPCPLRAGPLLSPGRRHAIVREHLTQAASALHAVGDQAPPRDGALVVGNHARAGGPARRSDVGAGAGRAPRRARRSGRRAGDGLRQSGERRADAAPPRPGADARRAQRRAPGARRDAPRPRRRAGLARADLRSAREPESGRRGAQSRARRPQPAAVHARDDRRRVRYARADPSDSRRARNGRADACRRPAKPTANTDRRRPAGISGRSACSRPASRCDAVSQDLRWRWHRTSPSRPIRLLPTCFRRSSSRSKRCWPRT